MMRLRGLVLLQLCLAALASGLEMSAQARDALVPGGLRTNFRALHNGAAPVVVERGQDVRAPAPKMKQTFEENLLSRRAAIAAVLTAAVPLAASAGFLNDFKNLEKEKAVIAKEDKEINALRAESFKDELQIAKDDELRVKAISKGDVKLAKQLAGEEKALKADEAAVVKKEKSLIKDESVQVAVERSLLKKVEQEKKAQEAQDKAREAAKVRKEADAALAEARAQSK